MRNVVINNKSGLSGMIKYCTREHVQYSTKTNKAVISLDFSIYLLEHILYLINNCFERHFLFFNSPKSIKTYEGTNDDKFICTLELPRLCKDEPFNMKIRSEPYTLKKDACKNAAYLALISLYEKGFLDEHLCPIDERFINQNELYFTNVYNKYGIASKNPDEIYNEIYKRI